MTSLRTNMVGKRPEFNHLGGGENTMLLVEEDDAGNMHVSFGLTQPIEEGIIEDKEMMVFDFELIIHGGTLTVEFVSFDLSLV